MPYEAWRCIPCIKSHKRCDRNNPTCGTCAKHRRVCHYKVSPQFVWAHTSINDFQINYKKVTKKESKEIKSENDKFINVNSLIKFKPNNKFEFNNNQYGVLAKVIKKFLYEKIMIILQCPSIAKDSKDFRILYSFAFNIKDIINSNTLYDKTYIPDRPNNLPLNSILMKSIQNYFIYINSVFPLFDEDDFDFFSKPFLLRLAILASGLVFMDKDPNVSYLISYFEAKINERIKYFYRLKPSLEMIQALLILVSYFKVGPGIYNVSFQLYHCAYHFSNFLGLHLFSSKSRVAKERERAMTYSCLNMVYLSLTFITTSYLHKPCRPSILDTKKLIPSKLTIDQNVFNELSMKTYRRMILSSFYNELSSILFKIRLLKEKCYISQRLPEEYGNVQLDLFSKLDRLIDKYISNNSSFHIYLTDPIEYKHLIYFIYHYLRHFILASSLYHFLGLTNTHIQNKIIKLSLSECEHVIQYGTKLPYHFMFPFAISFLSQCTIFISRFQPCPLSKRLQVNLALDYFNLASKFPHLNLMVKFNIELILKSFKYSNQISK